MHRLFISTQGQVAIAETERVVIEKEEQKEMEKAQPSYKKSNASS